MNKTSGKKEIITILALCALIAVLTAGVIGIFGYLDKMVPESAKWSYEASGSAQSAGPSAGASASSQPEADAPRFCPSCGKELHEGFQWGQFCPYCGQKVE